MGRLTSGAPAGLPAGAQLVLFAACCAALLAPPLWGVPAVAAVAYVAWLRRCRRLLVAVATLVVAYGLWLAVTTPV